MKNPEGGGGSRAGIGIATPRLPLPEGGDTAHFKRDWSGKRSPPCMVGAMIERGAWQRNRSCAPVRHCGRFVRDGRGLMFNSTTLPPRATSTPCSCLRNYYIVARLLCCEFGPTLARLRDSHRHCHGVGTTLDEFPLMYGIVEKKKAKGAFGSPAIRVSASTICSLNSKRHGVFHNLRQR